MDTNKKAKILRRIGLSIRRERKKQGLTLEVLSFQAGLNDKHLWKIENGWVELRAITLIRIFYTLDLDMDTTLKRIWKDYAKQA